MRKYNTLIVICVWMVIILFSCALLMDELASWQRMTLLLACAVVACECMECHSRIERAHAPLILRDESVAEKTKPPEQTEE